MSSIYHDDHTYDGDDDKPPFVMSLKLLSLLACPKKDFRRIPVDIIEKVKQEKKRFYAIFVTELDDMASRRIGDLDQYKDLKDMIDSEDLSEFYDRLRVIRRMEESYTRLNANLTFAQHRRTYALKKDVMVTTNMDDLRNEVEEHVINLAFKEDPRYHQYLRTSRQMFREPEAIKCIAAKVGAAAFNVPASSMVIQHAIERCFEKPYRNSIISALLDWCPTPAMFKAVLRPDFDIVPASAFLEPTRSWSLRDYIVEAENDASHDKEALDEIAVLRLFSLI